MSRGGAHESRRSDQPEDTCRAHSTIPRFSRGPTAPQQAAPLRATHDRRAAAATDCGSSAAVVPCRALSGGNLRVVDEAGLACRAAGRGRPPLGRHAARPAQPGHVPIGSLHSAGTPRQAVSQSRALSQAFGDCQAASRALRTLPRLEGPQGDSRPRIALRCNAASRRCIITCSVASSSRRRLMLPLPSWARTLAAAHVG